MRPGLAFVYKAWLANQRAISGSVSTDGVTLFSYMLPIAVKQDVWVPYGGSCLRTEKYVVREHYPSHTTQQQINAILRELPPELTRVSDVDPAVHHLAKWEDAVPLESEEL